MSVAINFNPLDAAFQQNPHEVYAFMREHAPVHHIESINAYGLFTHELCTYSLKHQPKLFTARDFIVNAFGEFDPVPETTNMIALDPPDHSRVRRLANKAFTPAVIRSMKDDVEAVIDALLDEVEAMPGRSFDFTNDFAAKVPASVTATIFGLDPDVGGGDFKRWTIDLVKAPSRSVLPPQELESMRRSKVEVREFFTEEIARRRKDPGTDLISHLVRAEEEDQTLSELEILSLLFIFIIGGAETPSHVIGTTLWELFTHDAVMAEFKANPDRLPDIFEETLRAEAPVHFIFQSASQEQKIEGVTIPEGAMVFAFIAAANRDPKVFADPNRFDINRGSKADHLAFARGPHYCIGDGLGRLMCTSAVRKAFERFPGLRPVNPPSQIEWMPSFWIRGPKAFPVEY
ncbi:MAG: cytochrome P450 [Sporichthyaceae bacterium]